MEKVHIQTPLVFPAEEPGSQHAVMAFGRVFEQRRTSVGRNLSQSRFRGMAPRGEVHPQTNHVVSHAANIFIPQVLFYISYPSYLSGKWANGYHPGKLISYSFWHIDTFYCSLPWETKWLSGSQEFLKGPCISESTTATKAWKMMARLSFPRTDIQHITWCGWKAPFTTENTRGMQVWCWVL